MYVMNCNVIYDFLREIQQETSELSVLQYFREKYPDVQWTKLCYSKTGDSVLHVCSRSGHEDFVKYILGNWPPFCVDFVNNDGKTALHEAAQFSHYKIAKVLLDNGANVDSLKRADWTPLMLACTKPGEDSLETVRLLLTFGANPGLVNKDGWNSLHLACRVGDLNIVKFLIDFSAKYKVKTRVKSGIEFEDKSGVKSGTKYVAEPNIHFNVESSDVSNSDCTILKSTAEFTATSATKTTIKSISDTDLVLSRTKNGRTCLHIASLHGNLLVIQYLVEYFENIDIRDNCGNTAFHDAVCSRNIDCARTLLQSNCDVNAKNNVGMTALHLAASEADLHMIKYVIDDLGVDPNVTDGDSRITPLHCAARKKQMEAVELIISLGGDGGLRDVHGRTASDYMNL